MKKSSLFMAHPLEFEVLEHDRVIAKVKLDYRDQTVEVWQDTMYCLFSSLSKQVKGDRRRCTGLL
ncbi:hypothetical protein [Paenibacillus sp. FSL K6-0108]|uniref:hypothetical protein n=1 Tax=Paenibacillus sp. FSL K6-0108 TaxID=2921417 RepID=UPI00324638FA